MMKLLLLLFILFIPLNDEARRANEAYDRGDFVTAERGYREALRNDPENARIAFNLANALAQQGKTEEALGYYNQVKNTTKDPELRSKVDYNIGNTLAMAQQWAQAKKFYKDALRFNPKDNEAKYNYELAIQKEEEQQQQQQDQQQGDGDGSDQKDDQQQQDQQQQNQQQDGGNQQQQNQGNDPQEQQNPQNGQQQQDEQQKNQPQQQQQRPVAGQMSKEEAEQFLKQAENKEKDILKRFKKAEDDPKNKNEKDW